MFKESGRETLTPLIPLSLRAIKGEGERKTEGSTCALAQVLPSSLVLVGRNPTRPHGGTLSPLIPLSLRAIKGEGERKTEGHTCAKAQVCPSSLVLVGRNPTRPHGGTLSH